MKRKFIKFLTIIIIGISYLSCGGIPGYLIKKSDSNLISDEGNKYLKITSHIEGASVNSFEETFTGTCDDSYPLTVTEISSNLKIISSICADANLTIAVGFKASYGSNETRSFSVTNGEESLVRSVDFRLDCPTGYIGVPGNSEPYIETDDFCVAKYEMKAELISNGELAASGDGNNGGSSFPDFSLIKPASRYDGSPWVRIQRGATVATVNSALNECNSLDDGTFDYYLIHNSEWQTIARNIEANEDNWIDDYGTMKLPRGHSDFTKDLGCITSPGTNLIEASNDDNQGYYCTGNTFSEGYDSDSNPGGNEQRRTNILSNREVIWDIGGNVWEFTSDNVTSDINPDPSLSGKFGVEYDESSCNPGGVSPCFSEPNRSLFAPLNSALNSTNGVGILYVAGGSYGGAIIRGGYYQLSSSSGIFYASLAYASSLQLYFIGFRCASSPFFP